MGNCSSDLTEDEKVARKKSKDIDKDLAKLSKTLKDEIKLLLLGPGESGKSTIFKQMKIIQLNGGYTTEELNEYKPIIFANTILQMKVLIENAQKLGNELKSDAAKKSAEFMKQLPDGGEGWSPEVPKNVSILWADQGIKATYGERDKKFQLNDSSQYFFENVERFQNADYVPNEQDILRARVRSTGIEEAEFSFEDMSFRMFDVGGQRSERRKWIHCFDCVTAVLFCVSLSEYDQTLREDESQNRMKESLLLFDEICNSPWFRDTAFILFMNKTDLLKEKLPRVDLSVCFPNYTGGADFDTATSFIKDRFLEQNTSPHHIYTHLTCAVSTDNIKFVFKAVRKTILEAIFSDAGIA